MISPYGCTTSPSLLFLRRALLPRLRIQFTAVANPNRIQAVVERSPYHVLIRDIEFSPSAGLFLDEDQTAGGTLLGTFKSWCPEWEGRDYFIFWRMSLKQRLFKVPIFYYLALND
jgi:hypothetical protein